MRWPTWILESAYPMDLRSRLHRVELPTDYTRNRKRDVPIVTIKSTAVDAQGRHAQIERAIPRKREGTREGTLQPLFSTFYPDMAWARVASQECLVPWIFCAWFPFDLTSTNRNPKRRRPWTSETNWDPWKYFNGTNFRMQWEKCWKKSKSV